MRVSPVEEFDAAGVARVFPELAFRPGEPAIFAPDDGVVFTRRGLAAIAAAARVAGADLAMPERMLTIGGVDVRCSRYDGSVHA